MKKNLITIIIISVVLSLNCIEKDDLTFAIGLYSDGNTKLAEQELNNFLKNYPQSQYRQDISFLLANTYLQQDKYSQAEELFDKLYENGSLTIVRDEIILGLAQSNFYQDKQEKAQMLFKRYRKLYPDKENIWIAYFYLGKIELDKGNLKKAEEFLGKAHNKTNDPRVLASLIQLKLKNNEITSAEEYLSQLFTLAPKSDYTLKSVINCLNYHLDKGNYQFIKDYNIRTIEEKSPYFENFVTIKAIAENELGNYQESLNLLENYNSDIPLFYKGKNNMALGNDSIARDIFDNLSNSTDSDISARSYFYSARLDSTPDEAIGKLNNFVLDFPDHKYCGETLYLLALNNFKLKHYDQTDEFLTKALSYNLESNILERSEFLKAENDFQQSKSAAAFAGFNQYLDKYPQGEFRDEALYKTGFYLYTENNYPDAFVNFDQLLTDYPQSNKVGMVNFYLGEIFYLQKKFNQALRYYNASAKGKTDLNWVNLRLAQIYYHLENYDKAESELVKVPEYPDFLFAKFLLSGNIQFAKKNYNSALAAYEQAYSNSLDDDQKEQALNKKAWTFYQLNRFKDATDTYQQLASISNSNEFILKAAAAAFSAEEYQTAIETYQRYLEKNLSNKEKNEGQIGLANSYYNNGDYGEAYTQYMNLVVSEQENENLKSYLNGMSWSATQNEDLDFNSDLGIMINNSNVKSYKTLLYQYKIENGVNKSDWDQVESDISQILKLNPDDNLVSEMKLLEADVLVNRGDLEQADKIFLDLNNKKTDANILSNWAKLKVLLNDNPSAIDKLRKASMLSRDEDIWSRLMELEVIENNEFFLNDYNRYTEFASSKGREDAQIKMVKWNINNGRYAELDTYITNLQNSKRDEIKAEAQYLKGNALYREGRYDEAIPELLRVRYLFPQLEAIRVKAEIDACDAYIDAGYKDEAEKLLNTIKTDLDAETLKRLGQKIYGVGE